MKRVMIELNQEHINNGVRTNPYTCPFVLAWKQFFKAAGVPLIKMQVHHLETRFIFDESPHNYLDSVNTKRVRNSIHRYDHKISPLKPGRSQFSIPNAVAHHLGVL